MRTAGEPVVVLDDLSTGDPDAIPAACRWSWAASSTATLVRRILREHGVRGIVHLAAKKQVEESVRRPLYYYRENVEGLRVLLEAATAAGVDSFVFSSSAAVYGAPGRRPRRARTPTAGRSTPTARRSWSGSGWSQTSRAATGLRYASLRYFNVAGAARPELADRGASNLVPMVFQRLPSGGPR